MSTDHTVHACGLACLQYDIPQFILLTPWTRILLEKLTSSAASQEIPPHFFQPEGSSPYSQVPATCPYPEPTPSSPHKHKINYRLINTKTILIEKG